MTYVLQNKLIIPTFRLGRVGEVASGIKMHVFSKLNFGYNWQQARVFCGFSHHNLPH